MEKDKCKHEWGKYRPNTEEGAVLVCADCGIELDVITRRPLQEQVAEKERGL